MAGAVNLGRAAANELSASQTAGAASLPVSVVIPAYNRPDMVVRAVRSALGQLPAPPEEIIVVDDCSTDRTAEAAARAGAQVVRHELNLGEGAARNTGIAHAREPWVALLDSDDEWLPDLLATLWPLRTATCWSAAPRSTVPPSRVRVATPGSSQTGRRCSAPPVR